jgi:hypothetical protein
VDWTAHSSLKECVAPYKPVQFSIINQVKSVPSGCWALSTATTTTSYTRALGLAKNLVHTVLIRGVAGQHIIFGRFIRLEIRLNRGHCYVKNEHANRAATRMVETPCWCKSPQHLEG